MMMNTITVAAPVIYPRFRRHLGMKTRHLRYASCVDGTTTSTSAVRCEDASAKCDTICERVALANGLVHYYNLLEVEPSASFSEIKKAYRRLAKRSHPDVLGDESHRLCTLVNEAYNVLSHPDCRVEYDCMLEQALIDQDDCYSGRPLSSWVGLSETQGIFVDENRCIGCTHLCVGVAPKTFVAEETYGRARCQVQWGNNEEDLQIAIDSCPVSCIHWVGRDELPALEHCMQRVMDERVSVGIMRANSGRHVSDVFAATELFLRKRAQREAVALRAVQERQQAKEKAEAARQLRARCGAFVAAIAAFANTLGEMASESVHGTRQKKWQDASQEDDVRHLWDSIRPHQQFSESTIPEHLALVPIRVDID